MRVIGVDVGGTKVATAVLDDRTLEVHPPVPTTLRDEGALVDQLIRLVRECGAADAVGIGVPSVVDFATGTIRSSVNIPLHGVPLRERLSDALGVPVFVDNDATVAALAEAFDEDLEPIAQHLVMITLGTGVGGGVIIGGQIFRGATGAAPELGHIVIGAGLSEGAPEPAGRPPHPGTFEALASGTALDRLAEPGGWADGEDVVQAAEAGDERAVALLRVLGERLGVGIGGGVSNAGELVLAPARDVAWKYVIEGVGTRTRIERARHGPQAGVRGAALLARQEMETHG